MSSKHLEIITMVGSNILFEASLLLILILIFKYKRNFFLRAVVVVILLEFFMFGRGNLLTTSPNNLDVKSDIPDFETSRYISTADVQDYIGPHVYWNHLRVRQPFAPDLTDEELQSFDRLRNEISQLPGNINLFDKRFNVSGYNAVVLDNYVSYWNSKEINSVNITNLEDQRLNTLGVEYVIAGYPQDYVIGLDSNQWQKIYDKDVQIYKNTKALDRAFITSSGKVELIEYLPEKVVIQVENTTEDKLVFTDSYYPGWKVYVNGEERELRPFENAFRQVLLEPGINQVIFRYEPYSVRIGAILSMITSIVVLGLLFYPNISFWISNRERS